MRRALVLCSLGLSLAACDSESPLTADDVVGTWTVVAVRSETQVTVRDAQTVLDPAAPVSGLITVRGSESASFPYLQQVHLVPSGIEALLRSFDPRTDPPPPRSLVLTFADLVDNPVLLVQSEGTDLVGYLPPDGAGALFNRSGFGYQFSDVPLVTLDGSGRAIQVSGSITFGSRRLPAGRPTTIRVVDQTPLPPQTQTYTFAASGGFVLRTEVYGSVDERRGTWSQIGSQVIVDAPLDQSSQPTQVTFEAASSRGTLRLARAKPYSSCAPGCLPEVAPSFGIRPETLLDVRFVTTSTLTRAATPN